MSWKGSLHYWHCGRLAVHVFVHALDPKQRRFYELDVGRRNWQLWPPPHVLNHTNEWTVQTDADLLELAAWVARRLKKEHEQAKRESQSAAADQKPSEASEA